MLFQHFLTFLSWRTISVQLGGFDSFILFCLNVEKNKYNPTMFCWLVRRDQEKKWKKYYYSGGENETGVGRKKRLEPLVSGFLLCGSFIFGAVCVSLWLYSRDLDPV